MQTSCRVVGGVIALVAIAGLVRSCARQDSSPVPGHADVKSLSSHVEGEFLVRFRPDSTPEDRAAALARVGAEAAGGFGFSDGDLKDLVLARIPVDGDGACRCEAAMDLLLGDPAVLYAGPNYIIRAQAVPNVKPPRRKRRGFLIFDG